MAKGGFYQSKIEYKNAARNFVFEFSIPYFLKINKSAMENSLEILASVVTNEGKLAPTTQSTQSIQTEQ